MWEAVRIGDLGKVITGKTPSSTDPEHFGDEYPFITPTDMDGNRKVVTARKISEKGYHKFRNQMLPIDSVCFVCIGATIGKLCITSETSLTNQQINSVVVNRNQYDPFFVYYVLSTFKEKVVSIAGGAATPIVNKTSFENVSFLSPALPAQRKIAAILSAYDDLIENNLRRIKILEEMAHNLYCEWFVKFRFPGYEKLKFVDSPLGMIPEGWDISTVENAFEITGGGTPSKKEAAFWDAGTVNWYSPTDLTATNSMFIESSRYKITNLGLKKSSARLFPAFSVMMTSRATLGVISINTTDACTNQGFITCLPNDRVPLYFLYHWLSNNVEMFTSLATGAIFKEITKGVFKKIELAIPPSTLITQFEEAVRPLGETNLNLLRRNILLRKTRDLLLPKLVSGEVDVSDFDIKIPEEVIE